MEISKFICSHHRNCVSFLFLQEIERKQTTSSNQQHVNLIEKKTKRGEQPLPCHSWMPKKCEVCVVVSPARADSDAGDSVWINFSLEQRISAQGMSWFSKEYLQTRPYHLLARGGNPNIWAGAEGADTFVPASDPDRSDRFFFSLDQILPKPLEGTRLRAQFWIVRHS